jgi:DNA-binding IclR family transcriptional regulator
METLAAKCHETVNLALFMENKAVVIERVESSEPLRTDLGIGTTLPAYCTGLGKVFLADLPQQDLDAYCRQHDFRAFTKRTITSPERLQAHLRRMRGQGFSIDDREFGEGIRCIAAPIRDSSGTVVAAMSISGPSSRLTLKKLGSFKEILVQLSSEIGYKFGYRSIL